MTRRYDQSFREQAVALYHQSSQSMQAIADEMGIPKSTFKAWVKSLEDNGTLKGPGKGHPRDAKMQALQKELTHVKTERDILKKRWPFFHNKTGKV